VAHIQRGVGVSVGLRSGQVGCAKRGTHRHPDRTRSHKVIGGTHPRASLSKGEEASQGIPSVPPSVGGPGDVSYRVAVTSQTALNLGLVLVFAGVAGLYVEQVG
jgi:hypothetical protein